METVFVKEGDIVKIDDLLIKLETIDFELEINRLRALTDQSRANLKKLIAGPTKEDIDVSETQVKNAEVTLEDAKKIWRKQSKILIPEPTTPSETKPIAFLRCLKAMILC